MFTDTRIIQWTDAWGLRNSKNDFKRLSNVKRYTITIACDQVWSVGLTFEHQIQIICSTKKLVDTTIKMTTSYESRDSLNRKRSNVATIKFADNLALPSHRWRISPLDLDWIPLNGFGIFKFFKNFQSGAIDKILSIVLCGLMRIQAILPIAR